jgi:hypothetical protein
LNGDDDDVADEEEEQEEEEAPEPVQPVMPIVEKVTQRKPFVCAPTELFFFVFTIDFFS